MYSYSYLFKYILVGDVNVGKTCIMALFMNENFDQFSQATIGVEFGSKLINIDDK